MKVTALFIMVYSPIQLKAIICFCITTSQIINYETSIRCIAWVNHMYKFILRTLNICDGIIYAISSYIPDMKTFSVYANKQEYCTSKVSI